MTRFTKPFRKFWIALVAIFVVACTLVGASRVSSHVDLIAEHQRSREKHSLEFPIALTVAKVLEYFCPRSFLDFLTGNERVYLFPSKVTDGLSGLDGIVGICKGAKIQLIPIQKDFDWRDNREHYAKFVRIQKIEMISDIDMKIYWLWRNHGKGLVGHVRIRFDRESWRLYYFERTMFY